MRLKILSNSRRKSKRSSKNGSRKVNPLINPPCRFAKNPTIHCVSTLRGSDWGLSLSGPEGPVRRIPGRFVYAWYPTAASKEGRALSDGHAPWRIVPSQEGESCSGRCLSVPAGFLTPSHPVSALPRTFVNLPAVHFSDPCYGSTYSRSLENLSRGQ